MFIQSIDGVVKESLDGRRCYPAEWLRTALKGNKVFGVLEYFDQRTFSNRFLFICSGYNHKLESYRTSAKYPGAERGLIEEVFFVDDLNETIATYEALRDL